MTLAPTPPPARTRAPQECAPTRADASQHIFPVALLVLVLAALSLLGVGKTSEYDDGIGPGGTRMAALDTTRHGPSSPPAGPARA
jgi:hypothetical protein